MNTLVEFDTSSYNIDIEAMHDDLLLTISKYDIITNQIIEISDRVAQEGFIDSGIAILKELLRKIIVFLKQIALKLSSVFNEYNLYALRMLKEKWLSGKIHYYYTPVVIPALKYFCKALHLFNINIHAAIPDALVEANKTIFYNVTKVIEEIEKLSKDVSNLESNTSLKEFKNIHTNKVDFIYLDEDEIYALKDEDIVKLEQTVSQFTTYTTGNNVSGRELLICLDTIRGTNNVRLKLANQLLKASKESEQLLKAIENGENLNLEGYKRKIKLICQDIPTKSLKTVVRLNKEALKYIDIMRKCTFTHPLQLGFVQKVDVLGYRVSAPYLPDMATCAKYLVLDEFNFKENKHKNIKNDINNRIALYEDADKYKDAYLATLYKSEEAIINTNMIKKETVNGIEFYNILQVPTLADCGMRANVYLNRLVTCFGFCTRAGKIFISLEVVKMLAGSRIYTDAGITYDMLVNFIVAHEHGHKVDLCKGRELTYTEFVYGKMAAAEGRDREQEVFADAYSIKRNGFDLETYKKLRDGLMLAACDITGVFGSLISGKNILSSYIRGQLIISEEIQSRLDAKLGAYRFNREKCFELSKEIRV